MGSVLNRRGLFAGALACGCLTAGLHAHAADPVAAGKTKLSADEAIELLRRGNDDFVNDRQVTAAVNRARRLEIAAGQSPFAVLVGCSDSRVAPELLFGRGLGELFIVRVAGPRRPGSPTRPRRTEWIREPCDPRNCLRHGR